MVQIPNQHDLDVFNLAHELVSSANASAPRERRRARRMRFAAVQRIAPQREATMPAEADFVDVRCFDLERGGFSFLMDARPEFSRLVAEFRSPHGRTRMRAEVAHVSDVLVWPSGRVERLSARPGALRPSARARCMALVGCRFVGRCHEI